MLEWVITDLFYPISIESFLLLVCATAGVLFQWKFGKQKNNSFDFKVPDFIWQAFAQKGFILNAEQKQRIQDALLDFLYIHKENKQQYKVPSYILYCFLKTYSDYPDLYKIMIHTLLGEDWDYLSDIDFDLMEFEDKRRFKKIKLNNRKKSAEYLRTYLALKYKGRRFCASNVLPDVFLLDEMLMDFGGVTYDWNAIKELDKSPQSVENQSLAGGFLAGSTLGYEATQQEDKQEVEEETSGGFWSWFENIDFSSDSDHSSSSSDSSCSSSDYSDSSSTSSSHSDHSDSSSDD